MSQKIKTRNKENRGGARKGAGKKASTPIYTEEFKTAMMEAEKRLMAEMNGTTIHDVMLREIYNPEAKLNVKKDIYKIYCDSLGIKATIRKIDITENKIGPVVGLPPTMSADEEQQEQAMGPQGLQ
jgi:hypothetical protein